MSKAEYQKAKIEKEQDEQIVIKLLAYLKVL
jgi:hypothetical protein